MINIKRISFSGYKSFKKEVALDNIGNVNLLIGKNNSGKSSVLDVINYIFSDKKMSVDLIKITQSLNENIYSAFFKKDLYIQFGFKNISFYNLGRHLVNKEIEYKFLKNNGKIDNTSFEVINKNYNDYEFYKLKIRDCAKSMFETLSLRYPLLISAERNILPEIQTDNKLESNGDNATSLIVNYLNVANKDEKLIEKNY